MLALEGSRSAPNHQPRPSYAHPRPCYTQTMKRGVPLLRISLQKQNQNSQLPKSDSQRRSLDSRPDFANSVLESPSWPGTQQGQGPFSAPHRFRKPESGLWGASGGERAQTGVLRGRDSPVPGIPVALGNGNTPPESPLLGIKGTWQRRVISAAEQENEADRGEPSWGRAAPSGGAGVTRVTDRTRTALRSPRPAHPRPLNPA